MEQLPRIRSLRQSPLSWDDARWESEQESYPALYRRGHHLRDGAAIAQEQAVPAEAATSNCGLSNKSGGEHVR